MHTYALVFDISGHGRIQRENDQLPLFDAIRVSLFRLSNLQIEDSFIIKLERPM